MKKFFGSILWSHSRGDAYRWKHHLFERSKREHQSERIRLKPIPNIRWLSEIADHPAFLGVIVILGIALCIFFSNVLEARKRFNQPIKKMAEIFTSQVLEPDPLTPIRSPESKIKGRAIVLGGAVLAENWI